MSSRAPQRIPSYWASSANRYEPNAKALPHENIRTKHSRRQIKVLVLFDEIEEGQKVEWRDHHHQPGMDTAVAEFPEDTNSGDLPESAEHGLMKVSMIRYTRSALRKLRTLASGSVTIPAQEPTTCTRSTGRCRGQKRSMLFTKTWPQDIGLALGQSMYDSQLLRASVQHIDILAT